MAVKCADILKLMEEVAPSYLAENWDNCGLQVGDLQGVVEKVLLTIDVNFAVAQEAVDRGATLIISHHPLLFSPLRTINVREPLGALINYLMANKITVFAAHTNLDLAVGGVNSALAQIIGLSEPVVLQQADQARIYKLVVFIPVGYEQKVRTAVLDAGAGWIGNYSHCSFSGKGTGTYRPLKGTNPFYGREGELAEADEVRLETIVPAGLLGPVLEALLDAHPYEEVAYDVLPLENRNASFGLGRVGQLAPPLQLDQFAELVKNKLGLQAVRIGGGERQVQKVAVCGGAGADLWPLALQAGADTIVTGDLKYHIAQDILAAGMNFIDAGHYGTEVVVLPVLQKHLGDICSRDHLDIQLLLSEINTDPFTFI